MSHHHIGIPTRSVEVTEGITGKKVPAELLVCLDCDCILFTIYMPQGINHVHFQCHRCGVSYCDGCHTPTTKSSPVEGGS